MTVVDVVAARLRVAFPSRVVFERAVPNKMPDGSAVPPRFYIVSSNVGDEASSTMADARDLRTPMLWVRCVSRREDPQTAADEVSWWAEGAREALRGLRPAVGRVAWRLNHQVSSQPFRDEGLPESTWLATEQWLAPYQA